MAPPPATITTPPSVSTPGTPLSPRQVATKEDPPQGVFFPIGHHWGTDLQVPKGIQATHRVVSWFPSHIAEIWTLVGEVESGWEWGGSPGRA